MVCGTSVRRNNAAMKNKSPDNKKRGWSKYGIRDILILYSHRYIFHFKFQRAIGSLYFCHFANHFAYQPFANW